MVTPGVKVECNYLESDPHIFRLPAVLSVAAQFVMYQTWTSLSLFGETKMGMLFNSQAIVYLSARLSNEFSANPVFPAMGLAYWQGNGDDAVEFRAALDGSTHKKAPALGSITLEYLDLMIPDSADGESPGNSDPSGGKGYKRWIIFWKQFRKKYPNKYANLVNGILDVLNEAAGTAGIRSITFAALEDSSASVSITDIGSNRSVTVYTPVWYRGVTVRKAPKQKNARKKAAKKKKL
jgi:hypothetical protein